MEITCRDYLYETQMRREPRVCDGSLDDIDHCWPKVWLGFSANHHVSRRSDDGGADQSYLQRLIKPRPKQRPTCLRVPQTVSIAHKIASVQDFLGAPLRFVADLFASWDVKNLVSIGAAGGTEQIKIVSKILQIPIFMGCE